MQGSPATAGTSQVVHELVATPNSHSLHLPSLTAQPSTAELDTSATKQHRTCPDLCGPKNAQPAAWLDTTSWTMLSNAAGRPEATAEPVIEAMERVICWSADANMLFLPCGHTCTCTACAQPFVQDAIYPMCHNRGC